MYIPLWVILGACVFSFYYGFTRNSSRLILDLLIFVLYANDISYFDNKQCNIPVCPRQNLYDEAESCAEISNIGSSIFGTIAEWCKNGLMLNIENRWKVFCFRHIQSRLSITLLFWRASSPFHRLFSAHKRIIRCILAAANRTPCISLFQELYCHCHA